MAANGRQFQGKENPMEPHGGSNTDSPGKQRTAETIFVAGLNNDQILPIKARPESFYKNRISLKKNLIWKLRRHCH